MTGGLEMVPKRRSKKQVCTDMYGYIVYKRVSGVDAVYFRMMGKSPNSSVYNLYPVTSCKCCMFSANQIQ